MIKGCFSAHSPGPEGGAQVRDSLVLECLHSDAPCDPTVARALSPFCFPIEGKSVRQVPEVRLCPDAAAGLYPPAGATRSPRRAQEYVICLTGASGERTYGFCRRCLAYAASGPCADRAPATLLLLSPQPWFPHFYKVGRCLGLPASLHRVAGSPA